MSDFKMIMDLAVDCLNTKFTVFEYSISYFDIMVFNILAGALLWFLFSLIQK